MTLFMVPSMYLMSERLRRPMRQMYGGKWISFLGIPPFTPILLYLIMVNLQLKAVQRFYRVFSLNLLFALALMPIAWLLTMLIGLMTSTAALAPITGFFGILSIIFPSLVIIRQIGRLFIWMFGSSKPVPAKKPNRV
jgi:hypothetical protein